MATVFDPIMKRFLDEYARPVAERMRNLQLVLTEMKAEYINIILPLAGASNLNLQNTDVLDDQRAGQGAYQVTWQDLQDLATQLTSALNALNSAGYEETRTKFTIKPANPGG